MAYILNDIPVRTRAGVIAKKLSCLTDKNLQECKWCAKENLGKEKAEIQQRIDTASKIKQRLENENIMRDDIIKESEAQKAYHGIK